MARGRLLTVVASADEAALLLLVLVVAGVADATATPIIITDGGVGGVLDHGLCLDRSVALTLEGLIRPHSMVVGSGCIYPSVVESFAWFLYISSPW